MKKDGQIRGYGYIDESELISKFKYFSMKNVANIIDKKGIGTIKLYAILREKNYINESNVANEQYVENGYFINQQTRRNIGGVHSFTNQVLVTIKGLELIKKILHDY